MSKSIMIHPDAENVDNNGCKKAVRKAGLAVRPPLQERTALGNVNGPRIQPSRTAKSQVCLILSFLIAHT